MAEIHQGTVIEEELDPINGAPYLSVEAYDDQGNMLMQIPFHRKATGREIVSSLKDDSMVVLLEASETCSAETVVKYSGVLSQAARELSEKKK